MTASATRHPLELRRRSALVAFLAAATAPALPGQARAADATLRYVEGSGFDTLDPAIQRTRSTEVVLLLLFNRLVKWKDTKLSELVPDLATSWTTDDASLVWTFKLRTGVRFHDGTPFNAAAVKATFDRLLDPKFGSPNRSLFVPVTAVEAPDDTTVVFRTKEPFAALLENLAETSASINSPTAMQKTGRNYGRLPVGTGPYKLEDWSPGERTTVTRFDGYFGGPAHFASVIYRPVPEGAARVIELESGNTDIATGIPPESADRVRKNPALKLEVLPSSFQVFFELNNAKPPFDNPRLRKAINHAIDRKAIVEKILGGFGSVPDSPLVPGIQAYTPFEPYTYDPEFAKKEFAAAYPGGYNDPIVIWTPSGRYLKDQQVAEATQGYLNAIGLKTEFRVWEWASYQQTLYRKERDGKGTGYGSNAANMWMLGTSIPGADWRLTRRLVTKQSANLSGYANKEFDELMQYARTHLDYAKRMDAYKKATRIIWEEDPPFLFLYNQKQLIGMQKNIGNLQVFAFEVPILAGRHEGVGWRA